MRYRTGIKESEAKASLSLTEQWENNGERHWQLQLADYDYRLLTMIILNVLTESTLETF